MLSNKFMKASFIALNAKSLPNYHSEGFSIVDYTIKISNFNSIMPNPEKKDLPYFQQINLLWPFSGSMKQSG